MPKRTNDFQRLIALIEQSLSSDGVEILESAEIEEYGAGRECDILIKAQVNRHPVTIALECRDHQRPQTLEWIDALDGKYRDLPVDSIVAVSSSGFTAQAAEKARRLGIRALSFQEAMQKDWPTHARRAASRWFRYHVVRFDTSFNYRGAEPEMTDATFRTAQVVNGTGESIETVADIVESLFEDAKDALNYSLPQAANDIVAADGPFSRVLHVSYDVEDRFVLDATGGRYELRGVMLTLLCEFEILHSAERHFIYNDALVTLSTVEDPDSGEMRSIGSVELPTSMDERPDVRMFEWEPKNMSRWKQLRDVE